MGIVIEKYGRILSNVYREIMSCCKLDMNKNVTKDANSLSILMYLSVTIWLILSSISLVVEITMFNERLVLSCCSANGARNQLNELNRAGLPRFFSFS